jgi:hypothetical protein
MGDPYVEFEQQADGTILWFQHYNQQYEHGQYYGRREPLLYPPSSSESKVYSFADSLKQVCVDVLGLRPEQCYGTDEQKNSLTQFKWEKLPEAIRWTGNRRTLSVNYITELYCRVEGCGRVGKPKCAECQESADSRAEAQRQVAEWNASLKLRTGFMTGREVMQVFGTDVMRKMFYDNVWVNATVNRIKADNKKLALIADMRFRTELNALYPFGAYIVRLERNILHDTHASEVDFDGFDWTPYEERTLVVPAEYNIHDKNKLVWNWLVYKLPHLFTA